MEKFILSIDQGTTGTKVLVMDTRLKKVAEHYESFEQHFPKPGWVEHDLNQIWESVEKGIQAISGKVDLTKLVGIGITNQRETLCFWDKKTLQPIRKAMVWQDRRTAGRCEALKNSGLEGLIQEKTGLLLDPYFSGTKLEWAMHQDAGVKEALNSGVLAVGTIDSFLLMKLTQGMSHATDPSNASRTLLLNLRTLKWDTELLELFKVPESILPEIKPTFGEFGRTRGVPGLPEGIPISGMIGDQQSALLGQAAVDEGMAKCTYGTGAFLLMNTGKTIKKSKARLLTTIAWTEANGATTYALEGSAFMAGATIQWLRDGLQMIKSSDEIEGLARAVNSSEGVVMVPAFTGLGAPYWDPEARAMISGLTRGTTRAHLARAALEGIAYQNVDILQAMEGDLGSEIKGLCVDGGASKNNLLMQIQADLLGRSLRRPEFTETTALGAIFAAGMGIGVWKSLHEIEKVWKLEHEFHPELNPNDRMRALSEWKKAVARVQL